MGMARTQSSDDRIAQARRLLEEAVAHESEAIAATEGEPRGMFFFNRGKAGMFSSPPPPHIWYDLI